MVKLNSPCLAQRQPPHGSPLVIEKRAAEAGVGNTTMPSANSGMRDNGRERELGELKNTGPNVPLRHAENPACFSTATTGGSFGGRDSVSARKAPGNEGDSGRKDATGRRGPAQSLRGQTSCSLKVKGAAGTPRLSQGASGGWGPMSVEFRTHPPLLPRLRKEGA